MKHTSMAAVLYLAAWFAATGAEPENKLSATRGTLEKWVEEQFGKLSTNSSQADKERVQTETAIKAANDSLEPAQKFAADFETQLTKFMPKLPQPLHDIL